MLVLDCMVQNISPVCAVLCSVVSSRNSKSQFGCVVPSSTCFSVCITPVTLVFVWSWAEPLRTHQQKADLGRHLHGLVLVWHWFGAGLVSWASSAHCWCMQGQLWALGCTRARSWMELVLPATMAGPRRDTLIQWLVAPLPKYLVARFGDSLFLLFCNGRRRWSPYIDFCGEKRLEKNPLDKGSEKH